MTRIAYVDGAYRPLANAGVSIRDRGFQFGDAVYEVWAVRDGAMLDVDAHFARLWRSLAMLRIAPPMADRALRAVVRETLRRNRIRDGLVYLQISRGAAPREHRFPTPPPRPTLVVTATRLDRRAIDARGEAGVRVITAPDQRWGRCDIKSTNLLANVLARQAAHEQGAYEAWLYDAEGLITEGTASTAWIVDAAGMLRTRTLAANILPGVTRATVLALAQALQIPVREGAFSREETAHAQEAFLTSATGLVTPVVAIDGVPVAGGEAGPITKRLRSAYLEGAPR